jgi:hypothetical protein
MHEFPSPQPAIIPTMVRIRTHRSKNTGVRSPLEANKFWLATNFHLEFREPTFGVLDISFGHMLMDNFQKYNINIINKQHAMIFSFK